jgi:hypothetical protein
MSRALTPDEQTVARWLEDRARFPLVIDTAAIEGSRVRTLVRATLRRGRAAAAEARRAVDRLARRRRSGQDIALSSEGVTNTGAVGSTGIGNSQPSASEYPRPALSGEEACGRCGTRCCAGCPGEACSGLRTASGYCCDSCESIDNEGDEQGDEQGAGFNATTGAGASGNGDLRTRLVRVGRRNVQIVCSRKAYSVPRTTDRRAST